MPFRLGVRHLLNSIQDKVPLQGRECPRRSNFKFLRRKSVAFLEEAKRIRLGEAVFNEKFIEPAADGKHLV